jgi:4-aminobutyrate aminotransferase-like enzyme
MNIQGFRRSLADIIGESFCDAVCKATAFCTGQDVSELKALATEPVVFWSDEYTQRLHALVDSVGTQVCPPFESSAIGAGTDAFVDATKAHAAPLSGFGCVRIGEDGRAYFIGKSEHYHVSLGHRFPGFNLLDVARNIGILHPEHNNMRGHVTRLLEERLIAAASGCPAGDVAGLDVIRTSDAPHILNRIINLQTGSLAAEAAMKMMLARFYRLESHLPKPEYHGRQPVFFVLGDYSGGVQANYHGTTLLTQMLRGLWPELRDAIEGHMRIVPMPINDIDSFRALVAQYDTGATKVAGLIHEFVLMNYGGIRLDPEYVTGMYDLCHRHDIPVAADEIQSGVWSKEAFFFREYGVTPDFVALGKGFPGGEYAASRIMTTSKMDNLDQFGALVTNGQEEIASLAYLVALEMLDVNGAFITEVGQYYMDELNAIASDFPQLIEKIEGIRHLASIFFTNDEFAESFAREMNSRCIDVSTHSYKSESLPAALTKLPIISTKYTIDFLIAAMRSVLATL